MARSIGGTFDTADAYTSIDDGDSRLARRVRNAQISWTNDGNAIE
jgi:hypothetical protein